MSVCNMKEILPWVSEISSGKCEQTEGRKSVSGDATTLRWAGDKNVQK